MAKYWWQDDQDDEDDLEDLNASARKVFLEENGINAQTLKKRFNEIVKEQSVTVNAALYDVEREYRRFLHNVNDEQKIQHKYQTYINVWNSIIDNFNTYGFFEAKERVQVDLDGLENATNEVDIWKSEAYEKTIGVGTNSVNFWVKQYESANKRHQEIENAWQEKADKAKTEIEEMKKSLGLEQTRKDEEEIKNLADSFSKDYNKFALAYPEDEFVVAMEKMIKSAYGYERYLGASTVLDLANKISYGSITNVFCVDKTKDEGMGR